MVINPGEKHQPTAFIKLHGEESDLRTEVWCSDRHSDASERGCGSAVYAY